MPRITILDDDGRLKSAVGVYKEKHGYPSENAAATALLKSGLDAGDDDSAFKADVLHALDQIKHSMTTAHLEAVFARLLSAGIIYSHYGPRICADMQTNALHIAKESAHDGELRLFEID